MSYEILIPQMSFSMTEGTLNEWMVADGVSVKEGDPLFLMEADKSTVEVPAPTSGVLRITGEVGRLYAVGDVIGYIE